jgi:Zn-finger nucleic acid-binding protein
MSLCPNHQTPLQQVTAEGHTGLRCGVCGGLWLPYSFINSLRYDRQFDPDEFKRHLIADQSGSSGKVCPDNCGPLHVTRVRDVELDWCPTCHGAWFDANELARMLEHHPPDGPRHSFGRELAGGILIELILPFLRWPS